MIQKRIIECNCAASTKLYHNDRNYRNAYKQIFSNTESKDIDVLILLELKETPPRFDPFLKFIKTLFKDHTFAMLHALGCTPEDFTSKDIISTYVTCKKLHIKNLISQYNFKSIITVGRAIYSITESKLLRPEEFFIPVNGSEYKFQLDDTYIYSSEFRCNVYPLVPLYQWIEEHRIKDCYEYKFNVQQVQRAIDNINISKKRIRNIEFEYVENPNDFLQKIINNKEIVDVALDTETTGLNFIKDKIYSISLAYESHKGYFLKFSDINLSLLIDIFNTKKVIFHNAQFDMKMLIMSGVENAKCYFDTMLASHSINENSPNALKALAWLYTYYGGYDKAINQYLKEYKIDDFSQLPKNLLLEYACYDAVITFQLYKYFQDRFEKEDLFVKENFYNFVMPAIEMIVDLELEGVEIDLKYFKEYNDSLLKKLKELEEQIFKIAKRKFNIRSNKELTEVFLNFENFSPILDDNGEAVLTKNKNLKLDKDSLQLYADEKDNPIAKLIIEYNHLAKELSQLGLYDVSVKEKSGKKKKGFLASIHNKKLYGGYKLHGTETGRMSGGGGLDSTINFQNMTKTEEFRKMFLCPKDHIIAYADYEGMEISIASQISGKGPMEKLLLEGKDAHSFMGSKITKYLYDEEISYENFYQKAKVEEQKKYKDIRGQAKTILFQNIYGATEYGLAQELNISQDEAKIFMRVFQETYPEISNYIFKVREHAKEFGWIKTLLGRKRRLPELTYIGKDSFKNYLSSFRLNNTLNTALNAGIQGTSGQTTVIAMTNIWKEFKEKNFKSKVKINVHDEIVFFIHDIELEDAAKIIKHWMEYPYYENVGNNEVKLKADLEIGEVWKFGKSYKWWKENPEYLQRLINTNNQRNLENENFTL